MLCVFKQSRSANAAAHAAGAARRPGGMASFGGAAAEKRKFKLVCFPFNRVLFNIPALWLFFFCAWLRSVLLKNRRHVYM